MATKKGSASKPKADAPAEKKPIDKKANFKRIAEYRTKNVLKQISLLSNCANRASYDYTEEQVEKMFGYISEAYDTARAKFQPKAADAAAKVISL